MIDTKHGGCASKHTPGPWSHAVTMVDEITGNDVISILALSPKAKEGRYPIGITSIEVNVENDRANACLIAAAPDLLEAAKRVLRDLDEGHVAYGTEEDLRLAIAKAEDV